MVSNRRCWMTLLAAALMMASALSVHAVASSGTSSGTTTGPMFCVGIDPNPDNSWDSICWADFMACMNGYNSSGGTYNPNCTFGGPCICYNQEVNPLPSPVTCNSEYEWCRGVGSTGNPPPITPAPTQ